jgi:hypothetical protein
MQTDNKTYRPSKDHPEYALQYRGNSGAPPIWLFFSVPKDAKLGEFGAFI